MAHGSYEPMLLVNLAKWCHVLHANELNSFGMCQKGTILLDSVDLVQAQNCQVGLTHPLTSDFRISVRSSRSGSPSDGPV